MQLDAATITALGGALAAVILALKAKSDVTSQKKSIENIERETKPNSGHSMKDRAQQAAESSARTEVMVAEIYKDMQLLRAADLELSKVDFQDRESATLAHQQIYETMALDREVAHKRHLELQTLLHQMLDQSELRKVD